MLIFLPCFWGCAKTKSSYNFIISFFIESAQANNSSEAAEVLWVMWSGTSDAADRCTPPSFSPDVCWMWGKARHSKALTASGAWICSSKQLYLQHGVGSKGTMVLKINSVSEGGKENQKACSLCCFQANPCCNLLKTFCDYLQKWSAFLFWSWI